MTARAVMISKVTASGRPSFCLIFFINFAQVTAGVGVFLRSFFSSTYSFLLLFPFLFRTNVR